MSYTGNTTFVDNEVFINLSLTKSLNSAGQFKIAFQNNNNKKQKKKKNKTKNNNNNNKKKTKKKKKQHKEQTNLYLKLNKP